MVNFLFEKVRFFLSAIIKLTVMFCQPCNNKRQKFAANFKATASQQAVKKRLPIKEEEAILSHRRSAESKQEEA